MPTTYECPECGRIATYGGRCTGEKRKPHKIKTMILNDELRESLDLEGDRFTVAEGQPSPDIRG